MVDLGLQGSISSHHLVLAPECFTLEPSENRAQADLDAYAAVFAQISPETNEEPEMVTKAPHNAPVDRIDEAAIDDPEPWAMTWRAFLGMHQRAAEV